MTELERYSPELDGQISYEHLHRYAIAKNYVTNLRVLDLASGEGYGAALLAQVAASVTGVDANAGAIAEATRRYGDGERLSFICSDGAALPLAKGSFDVVVSFETIEHVPEPAKLLGEIKRVLTADGLLIMSSPNRPIYNQGRKAPNIYHISEMDLGEFEALLRSRFETVQIVGQRMAIVSMTAPLHGGTNSSEYRGYVGYAATRSRPAEAMPGTVSMPDPEYFLSFCSDHAINHDAPLGSVYLSAEQDLWLEHAKVMRWASGIHDENEGLSAELRETQALFAELGGVLEQAHAAQNVAELNAKLAETVRAAAEEQAVNLRDHNGALIEQHRALTEQLAQSASVPALDREQRGRIVAEELAVVAPLLSRVRGSAPGNADLATLIDTLAAVASEQALSALRFEHAEAARAAAQAAADAGKATVEAITAQLEETRSWLSGAERRVAASELTRDELTGRIASLTEAHARRHHALEVELAAAADKADAAERARGEAEAVRDTAERARADMDARREAAERTCGDAEAQRDAAAEANRAGTTQLKAALRARRDAEEQQEESARAIAALTEEVALLRERLDDGGDALDRDQRLRKLDDDLESARSELAVQRDRADRLAGALAEAEHIAAGAGGREEEVEAARRMATKLATRARSLTRLQPELRQLTRAGARHRSGFGELGIVARDVAVRDQRARDFLLAALVIHAELNESFLAADRAIAGQVRPAPPHRPLVADDLTAAERDLLDAERWFDEDWYRDRADPGDMAPLEHFWAEGAKAGRTPHPLVDPEWIRLTLGPATSDIAALLRSSERLVAGASPLFDPSYYTEQAGLSAGERPYEHYRAHGWSLERPTHPLLSPAWMRGTWPARQVEDFSPERYLGDPALFGVSPHPLFDGGYYLETNPDVAAAGVNPLAHYLVRGWREGRLPIPQFSGNWYLATNRDVLAADACPLTHFVRYGGDEMRQPHPLFDPAFFKSRHPDLADLGGTAFAYFVEHGCRQGRASTARIDAILSAAAGSGAADPASLLAVMFGGLGGRTALAPTLVPIAPDVAWPPPPIDTYHLPQALRDYIVERHGEEVVETYRYIFSIIARHADAPDTFEGGEAFTVVLARIRELTLTLDMPCPAVSIVIPAYNNLLYTLTCILSIVLLNHGLSYEIIVADDHSLDATPDVIGKLGGPVRLVRQPRNLGFLGNCNAAASAARGQYIVLLNNDTIVLPGWLDALIAPFFDHADIGFVGSKLLNGDGTLQEAGGIFWSDGSAWNFGRNQDPRLPEFNYFKDVDYCSGASIAVPTQLWRDLDGFDTFFNPAYCEDADIAFRIREAGRRSVYAPHSELVHHEGRSHGRDTNSGIKSYQIINMARFHERWRGVLETENFPNAQDVPLARDRSRSRPHILVVDHYVPQRDQDAGSRSIFHYIRFFATRGFQVTLWPDNLYEDVRYVRELQAMGVEVIYSHAYHGRFGAWLAEHAASLDYAMLSRPHVASNYIDFFDAYPDIRKIYYGHDLHYSRLLLEYEVSGDPATRKTAYEFQKMEHALCLRSEIAVFPGFDEVEIVSGWTGAGTTVMTWPLNVFSDEELLAAREQGTHRFDRTPPTIMFVGGFAHTPNLDGIMWFMREVFPAVQAAVPDVELAIVGSHAPQSLFDLVGDRVRVLGRLDDDDLQALYRSSWLAIAPLRFGGGVKGKVVEAMLAGTPLALTAVGAQGIPEADRLAFVADDAAGFAAGVITALTDRAEASRRAANALDYITTHFSGDAVARLLGPHIPEVLASVAPLGLRSRAREAQRATALQLEYLG